MIIHEYEHGDGFREHEVEHRDDADKVFDYAVKKAGRIFRKQMMNKTIDERHEQRNRYEHHFFHDLPRYIRKEMHYEKLGRYQVGA